jgi:FkbM family methyltransferase
MMKIKHYEINAPPTTPPDKEGWQPTWHGYFEMTKCVSPEWGAELAERDRLIIKDSMIPENDFERDCFLSILADIKKENVTMFELGAGWGRICLGLAGAIDYKIIPMIPKTYKCLGIEGEPNHYQWLGEHFEKQKINGIAVRGAVGRKNGSCSFNTSESSDSCYGQAVTPLLSRRGIPSIANIRRLLGKKTSKIPMFTVDRLVKDYKFDHVDIIDMDVQGAEYDVVRGAAESIKNNIIDYWLIGTHARNLNDELAHFLSGKYELVVNLYPSAIGRVEGFAPISCHDGIQLYKRKGL